MSNFDKLKKLCQLIRCDIVTSTTEAKSGHPSSSLSAVELLAVLFFDGHFKQDISDFQNPLNDKFILSKGHAAPLLYSIYESAGVLSREELLTLRKFNSRLQGHPTPSVPFVDVTTGSLGQGLSVGVGMALGLQKRSKVQSLESRVPNVYVLLGDSEFAEGQNYEAMQLAAHYKLNNLVAILDVNRLGQRGETQMGWNLEEYKKRAEAFGWNAIIIENGNDLAQVQAAFSSLFPNPYPLTPTFIIAKTVKGAGVSFMEDKDGWHGKAIPKDRLDEALKEIGEVDFSIKGVINPPVKFSHSKSKLVEASLTNSDQLRPTPTNFDLSQPISTREAYGLALADLAKQNNNIIALDAETSNSTYAEFVKKETPEQFVECYIAEQNMVSMALGLSKLGFVPFASSFAAFLSRAFDQIRMSQYSLATLNIVGSHAGCSIGTDGASQMALEDIAMMRSIRESTILYPSDGVSAYKLTEAMVSHPSITYLRTTREKTPILYKKNEQFPIGGCKIHLCHPRLHGDDSKYNAVIIAAGITLHSALEAQKILEEKQIHTVVVDLYSVKPLDSGALQDLAKNTNHLIVVEDHYEAGGIGEAVAYALSTLHGIRYTFTHLCVRKEPRSGTKEELLRYEEIDAEAIVKKVEDRITSAY